jgi:predicted transcriptional regulator
MALEGSLKDFGLADILQLIYFQRKTGVLTLEGRMDRVRFLFIEGNIAGAESKRRIEAKRLGKVLVKKGIIEEKDLQSLLEEQRSSNVRLGNILVEKGIIEKEQILEILTEQIRETVVQVFGWKHGTYEFTPQAVPVDKDLPISIDTQHVLMEGLRIVDEWSLIEGKLTLDTVFTKKTEDVSGLTEEEEDILSLVNGENDVSTIIDITVKDNFSVSKTLVSLMEKGVIEQKEAVPVVTEMPLVEIKKPVLSYSFLPVLAIVVSVLLSLFPVFLGTDDIFKRFSASETINDLRFKIEAYKFEHGSYPETLDVISKGLDPWRKPFIYMQNGYAFVVLSTGPDGKEGTTDDIY